MRSKETAEMTRPAIQPHWAIHTLLYDFGQMIEINFPYQLEVELHLRQRTSE